MKRGVVPIGIALLVCGCAVTPRDRPVPGLAVPATWPAAATGVAAVEGGAWWEQFDDPDLTQLIQDAIASNADLAILAERVELARAEGRSATANARPAASGSTGIREGKEHRLESGFQTVSVPNWFAGGAFGWEIDWLGKWRDRSAAAEQHVLAKEADLNSGRLLLAAEVATAWFRLLRHRAEVEILETSLARQREILAIYRERFEAGILEASVVERQEAETTGLRRRQVRSRMLAETQVRLLDRLRGGVAGEREYPDRGSRLGAAIPPLPAALTAEDLRGRPDLAAAEAELRQAFSLERAARLDLFPSLSLRLAGTTASGSLTDPFQNWISSIGPRLDIPIWDPRRLAQLQIHAARAKMAAARFRAVALRAVEDVEVALVQFHHRQTELGLAGEVVGKARAVRDRTDDKRRAGIVSQLEVLEDERRALAAELSELAVQTLLMTDAVAVHRAMATRGQGRH